MTNAKANSLKRLKCRPVRHSWIPLKVVVLARPKNPETSGKKHVNWFMIVGDDGAVEWSIYVFHSYIWYINVLISNTRLFKWHFNPQMITKTAKRMGYI